MKNKILIRIAVLFVFAIGTVPALAQELTTGLQVNNYMSDMLDTLFAKGQAWGRELNADQKSGDYSGIARCRRDMNAKLDEDITLLSNMKDVGGSEEFRKAMINFFYYEKELIRTSFIPFESLTSASTDDDITTLHNNLITNAQNEDAEVGKIKKLQDDYAKKNGFTITPDDGK